MKTAAEIAQRAASPSALRAQTDQQTPAAEHSTDDEITAIWARMGSIYGHKWTSSYGEKVDPVWRRALKALPIDRLKVALGRCAQRADAWPPSLPEFKALARVRPEEVGAPELEAAWREASSRPHHSDWLPWSHRCVYWAAVRTGRTDLAERGQVMRKAFEREYQRALEEADALEEPPKGHLPRRTSEDQRREREQAAAEALPKLKAMTAGW